MADVRKYGGMGESRGPLRLAFLVDSFPDISTTFIHNQVTGLLARGHDVRVLAQNPGRSSAMHGDVQHWALRERTSYIGPAAGRLRTMRSLPIACLADPRRAQLLLRGVKAGWSPWVGSSRVFPAVRRIREPTRFDAIHCHFGVNGNLAVHLRGLDILQGPIVTTFHGYDMRQGEAFGEGIYEPLRLEGDRMLAISGYNSRLLQRWGFPPDRILEHHVGIDPTFFSFRPPSSPAGRPIRILTVANLVPVKGMEHGIDAISRLKSALPDVAIRLRLVGDGPERQSLSERVQKLGLDASVRFLGALGRDEVRDELRTADLFLLPSLGEATPVSLMEAQSTGLPVVATRVGAVEEVVLDGISGRLVAPGDSRALAAALADLIRDPAVWGTMGRAGRSHVEANYDIRTLVLELEAIYRSLSTASE